MHAWPVHTIKLVDMHLGNYKPQVMPNEVLSNLEKPVVDSMLQR